MFKHYKKNIVVPQYLIIALTIVIFLFFISNYLQSYGHLEHSPRYNGGGTSIGSYYIYQAMEPEYAKPKELTNIHFSIQDKNGKDIENVISLVEIYSQKTGKLIHVYPWTERVSGDFGIEYSFPDIGTYNVVVSITKNNTITGFDSYDDNSSSRSILYDNKNCNCERAVFNISISNSFGIIYSTTVLMGAMISLLLFGIILFLKYRSIKKQNIKNIKNEYIIKHVVPLLAIAAGIVHLVVNPEHSSLRIEYSIFLLVAAVFQIVYGLLYLIVVSSISIQDSNFRHKKSVNTSNTYLINLFGLVGTIILIGLYFYTLILPPPLSPSNSPEEINLAGILVQISEIALVIGIVYLIRMENRERKIDSDKLLSD